MTYDNRDQLPGQVKDVLPPHAQDIYKEAHNNALKQYKDPKKRRGGKQDDPEEIAHRVAWNAVKQKYEKGEDDKWHPKG